MPTPEDMQRAYQMWTGQPLAEQAQQSAATFEPRALAGPEVSLLEQATQAPAAAPNGPAVDPLFTMQPSAEPVMQPDMAPPVSLARPPDRPAPQPKVIAMPPQDIEAQAPAEAVPAQRPATPSAGGGGGGSPLMREQTALAGQAAQDHALAKQRTDESVAGQKAALGAEGARATAQGATEAKVLEDQQAELERVGAQARAEREIRQKVADERAAKFTEMNKQNAAVEIRDRRSTGQKVMGALAIAMSAMGDQRNLAAGLNIGMNVQTHNADRTVSMINEAVNRDLDIQRANLQNKRESAAAAFSEYGIARQAVGDLDAQNLLAEAAIKEKYNNQLKAVQARGVGEQAANVAALASSKLDAEIAQAREQAAALDDRDQSNKLFQLQAQREAEGRAAARAKAAAAAQGPDYGSLPAEELQYLKDHHQLPARAEKEFLKPLQEGQDADTSVPGYMPTKKLSPGDQSKAYDIHRAAESLKADYQRLAEIRKRNGGGTILNRNDIVEAEGIINGMAPKFSNLYGSGAPSKDEFALFKQTIINPTDYQLPYGFDPEESYKRGIKQIDKITGAQLGTYGYVKEETPEEANARLYGARER